MGDVSTQWLGLRKTMRAGPIVTAENIRWLLANDGFKDLVNGREVSVPRDEQLYRALTHAAEWGHLELIAELLAQGVNVQQRAEPLLAAAEYGHLSVIDFLVAAGASIDGHAGYWGMTPLMSAACGGEPDAVAILLQHGANPSATDIEGRTAIQWAEIGRDGFHGLDPTPAEELAERYRKVIEILTRKR